ncbi:MAG TPA: GNAT family N-acetyltransferase [Microvirga sp.]|nr:GNAT family N-acetyltransferase [Microvirga sp.]
MTPFSLRQAGLADIPTVAALHRRVREACLPYLPVLHGPDEVAVFFGRHVFPACDVRVAEVGGALAGFCAFRPGWLDHLYVEQSRQGRGIGAALLGEAMAANESLELWTFQRNERACRFYEAHGFRAVERTDGSRNEEREPDVRYAWRR